MIEVDLIISLMGVLLSGEEVGHFIIISELHFDFSIKDAPSQLFIPGVNPETHCTHSLFAL